MPRMRRLRWSRSVWPASAIAVAAAALLVAPLAAPVQRPPQTIDRTDPEFWERTQQRIGDLTAEAFLGRAAALMAEVTPADNERALLLLQKAAKLYPANAVVLAELSRAALAPYRWVWDRDEVWMGRGRDLLEEARRIDPDLPEVQRAGGLVAMLEDRLDEAEEGLRAALRERPEDLESLLLLGAVLRLQDRYREAFEVLDRAIALAPADWRGYSVMGDAYRDDEWYEEALTLYGKARDLHAGAFAPRFGEVAVFQRTGFYPIVNKMQLELLRDFPEWENLVLLGAAAWHMRVGEYDAALDELGQIEMGGRRGLCQGSVLYRIGVCRRRLGDPEGALEVLRTVVDGFPEARDGSDYGPLVVFAASRELAAIYDELGRPQEAIDVLEMAAGRDGAPLTLQLELAHRLAGFGLDSRAAAALQAAIAAETEEDPLYLRVRARVDLARAIAGADADRAAARGLLEGIAAEVRAEGAPTDLYAMARGCAQAGDVEAALDWLEDAVRRGYGHFDVIREEPDLQPLRETERYRSLMKGR
jgi:tetratricopeptide (TPR) repeat protein